MKRKKIGILIVIVLILVLIGLKVNDLYSFYRTVFHADRVEIYSKSGEMITEFDLDDVYKYEVIGSFSYASSKHTNIEIPDSYDYELTFLNDKNGVKRKFYIEDVILEDVTSRSDYDSSFSYTDEKMIHGYNGKDYIIYSKRSFKKYGILISDTFMESIFSKIENNE